MNEMIDIVRLHTKLNGHDTKALARRIERFRAIKIIYHQKFSVSSNPDNVHPPMLNSAVVAATTNRGP